jgi:hypothetical protein
VEVDQTTTAERRELDEELQSLYEGVVAGDPTAPAEFAELVLRSYGSRSDMVSAMAAKGWFDDRAEAAREVESFVNEYVARFMAALLKGTSKYDPERGSIAAYIARDLKGDVLNEADKHRRYRDRHKLAREDADVGDGPYPWNLEQTPEDEEEDDAMKWSDEQRAKVASFIASLAPADQAVVGLMADGIRDTGPYAEKLGITHLPIYQQRKTVNNIKDRLTKRMKRLR